MKKILLASFLAAIACATTTSFGQGAPAPGSPQAQAGGMMGSITPDERTALVSASQKARQDPDVVAAGAKMHDAMEAARVVIVATDPSLTPLFDKIKAAGAQRPQLTQEEIAKLRAGRDAINGTPESNAWEKATADYREAMRKAMIAADPSVAAILAKLPQGRPSGGAGAGIAKPASIPAASPQ